MHGYAAFGRVIEPVVHAATWPEPRAFGMPLPPPQAEVIDPDGWASTPALLERLREAWSSAREVWAQTTFYVFDPESWR